MKQSLPLLKTACHWYLTFKQQIKHILVICEDTFDKEQCAVFGWNTAGIYEKGPVYPCCLGPKRNEGFCLSAAQIMLVNSSESGNTVFQACRSFRISNGAVFQSLPWRRTCLNLLSPLAASTKSWDTKPSTFAGELCFKSNCRCLTRCSRAHRCRAFTPKTSGVSGSPPSSKIREECYRLSA